MKNVTKGLYYILFKASLGHRSDPGFSKPKLTELKNVHNHPDEIIKFFLYLFCFGY